jgi:peptidyl-prolyl cis-trans isomerase C
MRITVLSLAAFAGVSLAALAADPAPGTPLVKRGDVAITVEDFNAALARVPEEDQFEFRASMERVKKTVDSLYLIRMLANEARAQGIDKEPEVQRRLELQDEQLLSQIYLERFDKAIKTPDFEARAKELYAADPDHFKIEERVKLQHIMVDRQGRTKEEALKRIDEARNRLLAHENFYAVAREYSNDPAYRQTQGDVGPATYSELPPELAAVARKLKPGEVSDVIDAFDGLHVIVLTERRPSAVIPFEKVKANLIKAEETKYKRGVLDRKLGEITQNKDVVIYTDNIAALKTEPDENQIREKHDEAAARERK